MTLIFSLIERHLTKNPDRWDLTGACGGLRLDLKIGKNISPPIERSQWISRFESVSIIIASTVALIWVTGVQRYPFLILGPAARLLKLAPIWYQVYFPILLLTVGEIVRAMINLVRPDWSRFRAVYNIVLRAGGLLVVYYLLRAGSWVAAVGSATEITEQYAHSLAIVNQWIYFALLVAAILSVVMLIVKVTRLVRSLGRGAGSPSVTARAKEGN